MTLVTFAVGASGAAASGTEASGTIALRAEANASVTRIVTLESSVIREINAVRSSRGLARLTRSSALTRTAFGHSFAMATAGFFTHESQDGTPFWRRVRQLYGRHTQGWTVGENLAMFGGTPPTADGIVSAWMASPPHRANLLRPVFREAGVGIAFNPSAGGVFGDGPTWVITLDIGRR